MKQILKLTAICLIPLLIVGYVFYQSNKSERYREAQRTIDQLPLSSPELKAWLEYSAKQPGASDPVAFLDQWNKK